MHSKRANIYYLEHCRVLVNGGRVEYLTESDKRNLYWNIPIANTTTLLLDTGTSITQAAMRELAKAGVLVGFCGGGGTPLYASTEVDIDVLWLSPQSEYRPTEYLQNWMKFWFEETGRLSAARSFQLKRLDILSKNWLTNKLFRDNDFIVNEAQLLRTVQQSRQNIIAATDTTALLTEEARLTKQLFKMATSVLKYGEFVRAKKGSGTDMANRFLDHGNYLAYGLAATATWVLGLPHGLAVLHGKTRRGGLVFDVADLIKDALILPQAFISASRGDEEQEFRQSCLELLSKAEALDQMIETLKEVASSTAGSSR